MKTSCIFTLPPGPLRIGLIEAENVQIGPSSKEYLRQIEDEIREMKSPDYVYPDNLQKGIRSLLKAYGFHPSGRNRPASEYLFKDLQQRGSFNPINNAVDINNHLSLLSNLPISILDLDKSGRKLCLRVGLENETYLFNREGQALSLKNLLVAASSEHPHTAFGSPVKDSQATKVFESTRNLIGIIYTSQTITPRNELGQLLERFEKILRTEAKASEVNWEILDATI